MIIREWGMVAGSWGSAQADYLPTTNSQLLNPKPEANHG
jgi:hypothetical protein